MRRSPLVRTKTLEAKTSLPILRKKKCKGCGESFRPWSSTQTACSPACALEVGKTVRAKEEAKKDRARKEKLKTRSDYMKEAQIAFNKYTRLRDAGKPCICCGLPLGAGEVGGLFDCGHYRSVGAAPHLRFDERNAHGQRKQCNRYGSGRATEYRKGLIARIGIEAVEQLESDETPKKWSIEDLKSIRDLYRKKAKEIGNG